MRRVQGPTRRPASLVALVLVAALVPIASAACKKKLVLTRQLCEAKIQTGEQLLRAAEQRARAAASCDADDECVEARTASCLDIGCSAHGIPKSQSSVFAEAVAAVEGDSCKRWSEGDCATIAPRPVASCAPARARCAKHRCRISITNTLEATECDELYDSARSAVDAALAAADTKCTRDDDCIQLEARPACFSGCAGYAVSRRGAGALSAEVGRIDKKWCEPWVTGNCPRTTPKPVPSCAPVVARCRAGSCTNEISFPR